MGKVFTAEQIKRREYNKNYREKQKMKMKSEKEDKKVTFAEPVEIARVEELQKQELKDTKVDFKVEDEEKDSSSEVVRMSEEEFTNYLNSLVEERINEKMREQEFKQEVKQEKPMTKDNFFFQVLKQVGTQAMITGVNFAVLGTMGVAIETTRRAYITYSSRPQQSMLQQTMPVRLNNASEASQMAQQLASSNVNSTQLYQKVQMPVHNSLHC